eukprot:CAMPEP_0197464912 /NCGR_PEP_ID=MMETSP1175-20131217/64270_1 /TAXON_ID=1003142 /ORGANISM="Triceratium dubium, Strain CCMP147" /LENGTH=465 /DNA_ID=CAMNT_0043000915 /DNA_START=60 /DNA_END=1458 /DNA_ORIENTATION=-
MSLQTEKTDCENSVNSSFSGTARSADAAAGLSNENSGDDPLDLSGLPDVVLMKIFGDGYLGVRDVVQCSKANRLLQDWFLHVSIHRQEGKGNEDDDHIGRAKNTLWKQLMDRESLPGETFNDLREQKKLDDHIGRAKNTLWKQLMDREGLPGETFNDLIEHIEAWDGYCEELRTNLLQMACGEADEIAKMPPDEQKEKCHDFLTGAIQNYTKRVCNSHSWYKHLPTAADASKFEVVLNSVARMRYVDGKYIEYQKGDGTEFHYTWTTTKKYREQFGNFEYLHWSEHRPEKNSLRLANREGKTIYIPKYSVTAVIHDYSPEWDHYEPALRSAVEARNQDVLLEAMDPSWVFRHHVKGGKLPLEAANDLKAIAKAMITTYGDNTRIEALGEVMRKHFVRRRHCSMKDMPDEEDLCGWAKLAARAQCNRERVAIAEALYDVCVGVYGEEWVPCKKTFIRATFLLFAAQ